MHSYLKIILGHSENRLTGNFQMEQGYVKICSNSAGLSKNKSQNTVTEGFLDGAGLYGNIVS